MIGQLGDWDIESKFTHSGLAFTVLAILISMDVGIELDPDPEGSILIPEGEYEVDERYSMAALWADKGFDQILCT